MSHQITEGKLSFTFDDDWTTVKYDDHRDFTKGIHKLNGKIEGSDHSGKNDAGKNATEASVGTKAVDILGVFQNTLYLIEIKDFREHRIENKKRIKNGALALEVAVKVRDTIAGMVGASRQGSDLETWKGFVKPLLNTSHPIQVILFLEEDPDAPDTTRTLTDELKRRLQWLTPRVMVANRTKNRLPRLEISSTAPIS